MTRFLLPAVVPLVFAGCAAPAVRTTGPIPADAGLPDAPREFRGVWVATVANIDWPSRPGLPADSQRAELVAIMDRAAALNLNAVVLQVRPAADALYPSELEPWSEYLTGAGGRPPAPFYDPLAFAVDEAHRRGLELHAWFNPYRARHPTAESPVAATHVAARRPEWVREYGRFLWMDPGVPEVRAHSLAVMLDVVRRYDVDGVHIDDYFYPYPGTDSAGAPVPFPDEPSWRAYVAAGGSLERDDWRRENVNLFIRELYAAIKAEKPWVKFGISPFGFYRPDHPEGQGTRFDQYAQLYADARLWLREGWMDYYTPQLYWAISRPDLSYPVLLRWWVGENRMDRHMWPGNFTSRVPGEWRAEEITDQVWVTRGMPGATGNVHFSMRALMANPDSLNERLLAGPYRRRALVPASPWLGGEVLPAPRLGVRREGDDLVMEMEPAGAAPTWWLLRVRRGGAWSTDVLPGRMRTHRIAAAWEGGVVEEVAVSAVNRRGVEWRTARAAP